MYGCTYLSCLPSTKEGGRLAARGAGGGSGGPACGRRDGPPGAKVLGAAAEEEAARIGSGFRPLKDSR